MRRTKRAISVQQGWCVGLCILALGACRHPTATVAGVESRLLARLAGEGVTGVSVAASGDGRFAGTATRVDGIIFKLRVTVQGGRMTYEATVDLTETTKAGTATSATGSTMAGTIPYEG